MRTPDTPLSTSSNNHSDFRKNILRLAILQALACGSTGLYAANITVDSSADAVPAVTNDGLCTLREALQAANTNTAVDTCVAGAGADTISFDNTLAGSTITLGGSALVIDSDLSIDGDLNNDGQPDITLDAGGTSQVIDIYYSPTTPKNVTLDGLTITGGRATSPGGGISTSNNNLTLSNSMVSNNSVSYSYGGGIDIYSGNLSITNSTISGNSVTGTNPRGGGIYSYKSNITLTDSTVTNNTSDKYAGGIYMGSYGSLTLTRATITNNQATTRGGGAFQMGSYNTVTITNSTLSGNTAGRDGGAIKAGSYNTITITDSTFSSNTGRNGGAININSYNTMSITGSTISGNTANTDGGGIADGGYNTINITNSTISGNTSSGNGGGIYANYSTMTVTNSTIVNNTAPSTGGIYAYSMSGFKLVNSILANNTGGDCLGSVTTNTNNLITDGGTACGIMPLLTVDPQLGTLADNGGLTQTHLPAAGSPVLDAGDNTDCGTGLGVATDQRGVARDDGACDIGAVEGSVSLLLASVQLDATTATVAEDGGSITLNLTRSGNTATAISVDYTTADGSATAPADYTANTNTLNFASGVTSQSITIAITDDTTVEGDESFTVTLSNPQLVSGSGTVALGSNTSATVTITDNDSAAGGGTGSGTGGGTSSSTSSSTSSTGSDSKPKLDRVLALDPWWMLLAFTGWLGRRFKS